MKTLASLRVLVVGGGFAGMSAAIELRKFGAEVDLCEIDPGWRNDGAGISLGGATLRAFRQLGILEPMCPPHCKRSKTGDGSVAAWSSKTPAGSARSRSKMGAWTSTRRSCAIH